MSWSFLEELMITGRLTLEGSSEHTGRPTPYSDVNAIVSDLTAGMLAVLGDQVIGLYLDGSLANGDFDEISDIDFIAVTRGEVSDDQFLELQRMHARITNGNSIWATELEGSYISQDALRRHDPANATHPNIERGPDERLKIARHDAGWVIHRHIMRERGIVVLGPPPATLVDPISPVDLKQAAHSVLQGWAAGLLTNPNWADADGYHSYIVLTLCRILYTIKTGAVASKRASVVWAQTELAGPWRDLIERAWNVRQTWFEREAGATPSMSGQSEATRAFLVYALEQRE
jgi:hypothetical protein